MNLSGSYVGAETSRAKAAEQANADAISSNYSTLSGVDSGLKARITTLENKLSGGGGSSGITLDQVYPVGSIYMSMNSTSPAKLFGGRWERIYGRFLLGAGGGYSAGHTGGEAKHYLTNAEMPMHTHGAHFYQAMNEVPSGNYGLTPGGGFGGRPLVYRNSEDKNYPYLFTEGGGKPHNNMPPYLVVYIWKRTA